MKRTFLTVLLVLTLVLFHSCSIFKTRTVNRKLDETEVKTITSVKKEFKDSVTSEKKGISTNTSKVLSEEIIYRKGSPDVSNIELSATFRLDTSSSMRGDTALKLVDVNNNGISVAIYQNKKTNELMAKVSTNKGSKTVPFEELQIKRNYQENTSDVDTTSKNTQVKYSKLDSTNKTDVYNKKESKETSSQVQTLTIIFLAIGGVVFIIGLVWGYKKFILKR